MDGLNDIIPFPLGHCCVGGNTKSYEFVPGLSIDYGIFIYRKQPIVHYTVPVFTNVMCGVQQQERYRAL